MSPVKSDKKIYVDKNWCKGCGICIAFCPKQVLGLDGNGKIEMRDDENCIRCGQCELRCPDFAIYLGGAGSDD